MAGTGDPLNEVEKLRREAESLKDGLARLNEVSRRITESLDLATVLREVVDGARALTSARYGALAVFDDRGRIQEFITSGISEEQRRNLGNLPKGLGLLGYLNEVREPLRLEDLTQHPRAVGFPENHPAMTSFLGAPIRHLGEAVGTIFLTEKVDGGEFTADDEETLVMFASQAALAIGNATRYEEERQAREEMETERRRLAALVESSPVGVSVVDAATRTFASVNQEAERILGMSPEPGSTLVRYHEAAIYRRTDGRKYESRDRPLARALDSGEVVRAEEILLERPDGRRVTTLVNATPIHSEEGDIVSAVAVIQDMTRLEEIQRMRNDFLAMVSHELRSPLTLIKGSTATVLSSSAPVDPIDARRYFQVIDEQADHLSELVSNLLDVTRIEAGALMVTPRRTDLKVLVEEAVEDVMRGGARNRFEVGLEPDLPPVAADPQRVRQLLDNVLSNASKYSPESSPIRVAASVQDPYLAVSVTDEGQGFSADQVPRLFRKFSRLNSRDGGENVPGEGLGLAICKGIVEAHGGRISAESDGTGLGTRFTFTIPLAPDAKDGPEQDPAAAGRVAGTGNEARILSLDDEPQMQRYIRNVLADAGHSPIVTGNPDEMLHLVEMEQPDLLLLDLVLPGTNGFELMERVRKISELPVIFLTGSGEEENMVRALELGASDYIIKPFSPTELLARIGSALRSRAGQRRPEERRPFRLADLTIDYGARLASVSGVPAQLTATEYRLLFELSINAGRVLTHAHLLERVWGMDSLGSEQLVRVFVGNLRRKLLDDARTPKYIFTEPRVGYRMAEP